MLTGNRLAEFNLFFASLDSLQEQTFTHAATEQRFTLQEEDPSRVVSLIDCLENIWDEWRTLTQTYETYPTYESLDTQIVWTIMRDDKRIQRHQAFRELAGA